MIRVCALCCALQCWNTKLWQAEQASEDKILMEEEKGKHRERERQSDLRYQGKEEKEGGLERQWL